MSEWLYWAVANGLSVADPGDLVRREIDGVEHWMLVRMLPSGKRLAENVLGALRWLDGALSAVRHQRARYRGLHVLVADGSDPGRSASLLLDGREIDREQLLRFLRFEQPDEWYERRAWPVERGSDDARERGREVLRVLRKFAEETGFSLGYQLRYLAMQGCFPKDVAESIESTKGVVDDEETLIAICADVSERHLALLRDFLASAQWTARSLRLHGNQAGDRKQD